MPLLAATATATTPTNTLPASSAAVLILLASLITLGYLGLCWLWPFRACRRCSGTGKRPAWIGNGFRFCSRCDGTGHALRAGRHVMNALRGIHGRARH